MRNHRRLSVSSAWGEGHLSRTLGTGWLLLTSLGLAACGDHRSEVVQQVGNTSQPVSIGLIDCYSDPRVTSQMVSLDVCAGARVFFDEEFDGNGRTCGSCHRAENNFTVEPAFIGTLDQADPLFIAENDPSLADLETPHLREFGLIKEHVDDFESPENKFVARSVPHLFSIATTLERDPGDGTSADFAERTGWGGDGVVGGLLRDFTNGAIPQHFATDLDRVPGEAFRFATEEELDQVLAFQLALGRTNELDLDTVTINDSRAESGRLAFLDPQVGNCNTCHGNAGGNFLDTGLNRNLDTGTDELAQAGFDFERPAYQGVELRDGGFGGQGLTTPNFVAGLPLDSEGNPNPPNAFGDGTFNIPSLIEAADTAPFFHHHNLSNLEGVISTYGSSRFADSPAAQMVGPVPLGGTAIVEIAQFLRAINVAFNLSLSVQRLQASELLNFQYWNYREEIQIGLIELAVAEIDDALQVIDEAINLYPAEVPVLEAARNDLTAAMAAPDPAARLSLTRDGLEKLLSVQPALGTNLDFELGEGNLMF